ncbi:MAG TPA: ABC transporter ATP-binding protein [Thermoplasmataceae archaeon]|nr:ABC transporter ATP-binding protein [Thermoplasmataceae archaeon]
MGQEALLKVRDLTAGYGEVSILKNISFDLREGDITLLLGTNGSGKTTLLKTIAGLLNASSGKIIFDGKDITGLPVAERRRIGITFASEDTYFPTLTVKENLLMSMGRQHRDYEQKFEEIFHFFPELEERARSRASSLSGGQRKMLIMGRAIVSGGRIIVIDEPSSGLSPLFVDKIIDSLTVLKKKKQTILLAEQNVEFASLAEELGILDEGRMAFFGRKEEALDNDVIRKTYFSI